MAYPLAKHFCLYQGIFGYFTYAARACSFAPTGKSDVAINLYTTFAYYVPTVIMGVSYFVVLVKTWITYQKKKSSRALQRRMEISWMLFVSFIWHCCTIYPFIIINAFFAKEFARSFTAQLFIRWLGNSYNAVNPVFFWASSKMFQDGVKKVLTCYQWRWAHGSVGPSLVSGSASRTDDMAMSAPSKRRTTFSERDVIAAADKKSRTAE
ncbi:hypothetical protein BV898_06697 [Hypsibius exemplaris]|uniref:G-protein coupled receptors family 1 profile domain-containing protein n=1 Tax=Hypsibius exemplaris TaxID=2072580 RepID=A0A1W0WVP9_HYPEX|nr:hypothetical protein BV898_06697 [Hypsibius exemplaris]